MFCYFSAYGSEKSLSKCFILVRKLFRITGILTSIIRAHQRLADKGTGDTPKNGKPKKEVKSKPEDESDKDIGNSDKIVMKSKKRIRKGKKKQKGEEDGVKQKEDGAETKEKVTHEHGRGECFVQSVCSMDHGDNLKTI